MVSTSYYNSPFYPNAGGYSSGSSQFRIQRFTNNRLFNEMGSVVDDITFQWAYLNGVVTHQSISPLVGNISVPLTSYTLGNADITSDTTFTLDATCGVIHRTATTQVRFVRPVFFGKVPIATPAESDILAMDKRIDEITTFITTINLADEYSCFAAPMTNRITDIQAPFLDWVSILDTYQIIDDFPITMIDGTSVPYQLVVKKMSEHTSGQDIELKIVF